MIDEVVQTVSNKQIYKLGKRISKSQGNISNEDLQMLQNFRISFSKSLTYTFNKVRELSDDIHQSSIVAFRLKRIDTIMNKLKRESKMSLATMGDIAGIRCIFFNDAEVYKALNLIESEFEIVGIIRDYIKKPKAIGYKGIHVYIKDVKTNKRIEIQLRTLTHHNWATLIEITDFLYDLRLKEIGDDKNTSFGKFHALMSSDKELTKKEADLIYNVLNKTNFISKLSKTFRKNNNEVKKRWAKENTGNSFFLIEASKKQIPILRSFKTFEEAETAYFAKYKEDYNAEIVLTSIRKPNFKQISIAYANYILTYHTFIKDIEPILKELAKEAIEHNEYIKFKKIFKTYEDLQANVLLDAFTDSADLYISKLNNRRRTIFQKGKRMSKFEEKKLKNKISTNINHHIKSHEAFMIDIESYISKKPIIRHFFVKFINKYKKRIVKLLINKQLEFEKDFGLNRNVKS